MRWLFHFSQAKHHPAVPSVRVGVRDGEPDQGGRRAVAVVLDHLLLRHAAGDGGGAGAVLDPHLVPGEAAVRGVAGAAAVQGRLLHLREARQGAAPQVPRRPLPHGPRPRR
jgi:hypothetical protein